MPGTVIGAIPKAPEWLQSLSTVAWVNSVAISDDGTRVVGATYIHDYESRAKVFTTYGTYCYDATGQQPQLLWSRISSGWDGTFAVGISGDGGVIASGSLFTPARTDNLITGPSQAFGWLTIFDAQNGTVLFDSVTVTPNPIVGRINVVALSRSGDIVAAAADQLSVFVRNGNTYAPVASSVPAGDPDFRTALGPVAAVAVHPTGQWLVGCNQQGQLLVATINGGAVNRAFLLRINAEPIDCANAASPAAPVRFLSVAVSAQSDAFIGGGSNVVYRGTLSDVVAGQPLQKHEACDAAAPAGRILTGQPLAAPNVRWTAISADGLIFAAVANRIGGAGQLLIYDANKPGQKIVRPLDHNPNGVSMDHEAEVIAVSDGYPVGKLATFHRFDFSGTELWRCQTPNMNWPVAVSANGAAIAGGGDDGCVYYFHP